MTTGTVLAVLKIIDLVATAAIMIPELKARYEALSDMVKTMVEEDRDPTIEEWAAIDAETDDLMNELRS